jgi:hypothetical protein
MLADSLLQPGAQVVMAVKVKATDGHQPGLLARCALGLDRVDMHSAAALEG